MSTDCENLLKKLLVLNPVKRGSLEVLGVLGAFRSEVFHAAANPQSEQTVLMISERGCVISRRVIAAVFNNEATEHFIACQMKMGKHYSCEIKERSHTII